jgi:hypothetical protein
MAALAVGGAVAAAGAQATTISMTSPTLGGASQLIFWVSDVTTSTTYADVLTQSVASMFTPPGTGVGGVVNTYTGSSSFNLGIGGDSSLVSFINTATGAGNTLEWGITAGATTNSGPGTNTIIVTGAGASAGTDTTTIAKSAMVGVIGNTGLAGDVSNLVLSNTDGSGFNATLNGVIGMPASKSGTNITYYGAYPDQSGLALNQSSALYAITNQPNSATNAVSYSLGTVALTGSGTTLALSFTGNGSSVPLPAAVWLLGSGLLGLAGVARRRDSKTQAA